MMYTEEQWQIIQMFTIHFCGSFFINITKLNDCFYDRGICGGVSKTQLLPTALAWEKLQEENQKSHASQKTARYGKTEK